MLKIILISLSAFVLSTSSFASCERSQDCKCRPGIDQETCKKLGGGPKIKRGVTRRICVCKYR